MAPTPLTATPLQAAIEEAAFDLYQNLLNALEQTDFSLQTNDILVISSKYVAISEGRVFTLEDVAVSTQAEALAQRYNMDSRIAQLVLDESDHIFGGIELGYLLTAIHGVILPNAGLDRSNIPCGKAVLFPKYPYQSAARIRQDIRVKLGVDVGIVLSDSCLMPGRMGTTGVALATAGFEPLQDERGKPDLFGNKMVVTQRGTADTIAACAQIVMGERDEATPIVVVRNSGVALSERALSVEDVAIPWQQCIYVESMMQGQINWSFAS